MLDDRTIMDVVKSACPHSGQADFINGDLQTWESLVRKRIQKRDVVLFHCADLCGWKDASSANQN